MKYAISKLFFLIVLLKTENTNACQFFLEPTLPRYIRYLACQLSITAVGYTQKRYNHTNNQLIQRYNDSLTKNTDHLTIPSNKDQNWFKKNSRIVRLPVCSGSITDLANFQAPLSVLTAISSRYVVIDVEATGGILPHTNDYSLNNKITELACVDVRDLRVTGERFHSLVNPCREVMPVAQQVTGYTWNFLKRYPLFEDIVDDFLKYIEGKVVVVHDASLDIPLLNNEIKKCGRSVNLYNHMIIDTLHFANAFYPHKKKNLSRLCHSYGIDTSQRKKHNALLDADILARLFCCINRQGDFVYTTHQHCLSPMSMEDFLRLDPLPEYFRNKIGSGSLKDSRFRSKLYHPRFMDNYPAILSPFTDPNNILTHANVAYLLTEEQENAIKDATGKNINKNFVYSVNGDSKYPILG